MSEHELLQSDLGELLTALGMGDHARPWSPHEVFQEALGALRQRLAIADCIDNDRSNLAQQVESLAVDNARLRAYEDTHATCVQWTAWSITDADSDPSDPGITYCTEWHVGIWPVGAPEPLFKIFVGADRNGEIAAKRIAERLRSEINTVYLRAARRDADSRFARNDVKSAAEKLRSDFARAGLLHGAGGEP